MKCDRIGEVAGAVWNSLRDSEGGQSITELKKMREFTGDEVVAAIGWLAREGKIQFVQQGKKNVVTLCEAEFCV